MGDSKNTFEGSTRQRLAIVIGAGVCAVLLALSTNVAASLVPHEWTRQHSVWVWVTVGVLAILSVGLAAAGRRHDSTSEGVRLEVTDHAHAGPELVGSEASVDRSVQAGGPVVIAEAGATVSVGSLEPSPSAALARRPGQIVVGELPSAPPALVARVEVEELAEAFAARDGAVCVLTGGRGAGKTQVAAEYARRAVHDGVDVVAWVSADDTSLLLAGLASVARRLDVADPEGDSEESAVRLREELAVRNAPVVLVLDNAVDPHAARRYLPSTGASRVVVTSTDRAFGSLGTEVEVGVFERPESLAYLHARTGLDDVLGADAVAEELGDLPLALAQAAGVIRSRRLSYQGYLDQLRSLPLDEILPAGRGDAYPHSVARAIALSVREARRRDPAGLTGHVLDTMSVLATDTASRHVLSQIPHAAEGGTDLDRALEGLVEASLLGWAEGGVAVAMHRVVARVIRDQLEASGDLATAASIAASGLRGQLVPEARAWEERESTLELIGHTTRLWRIVLDATERGLLSREDLEGHTDLVHWAVRHLNATADLSRAIQIATSARDGLQRVLGGEHPQTLTARSNLAYTYESAGRLNDAIQLSEQALTDSERVLGADHPETLTSRNNLAYAYRSAGRFADAVALYERTLSDRERVLGEDHPDTLTSRNNLAGAYAGAGRLDDAIMLHERTLSDRERVFGEDHPDTLVSRNNLAGVYHSAGRLDDAIPLHERTLADSERLLGGDHPQTLASRNNLAHVYHSAGRLDDAIRLHERTLADADRLLGGDHPHTLSSRNNLAGAYRSAGRLDEAIVLHERTLADRERILGREHPDTLTSRNNLAGAYHLDGRLNEAMPLYERTLSDSEQILGPDHPDTLISRGNLAYAYESAGRLDEAISLYTQTLTSSGRVLGRDHPNTLALVTGLARTRAKQEGP